MLILLLSNSCFSELQFGGKGQPLGLELLLHQLYLALEHTLPRLGLDPSHLIFELLNFVLVVYSRCQCLFVPHGVDKTALVPNSCLEEIDIFVEHGCFQLEGLFLAFEYNLSSSELPGDFLVPLLHLGDSDVQVPDVVSLVFDHVEGLIILELEVIPLEDMVLDLRHGLLVEQHVPAGLCPADFDFLADGLALPFDYCQLLLQAGNLLLVHFLVGGDLLVEQGYLGVEGPFGDVKLGHPAL